MSPTKKTKSGFSTERWCHDCRTAARRQNRIDNYEEVLRKEQVNHQRNKKRKLELRKAHYHSDEEYRQRQRERDRRWREHTGYYKTEKYRAYINAYKKDYRARRKELEDQDIQMIEERRKKERQAYQREDPERRRELRRAYRKRHREKIIARNRARKAREKGATGHFTAQDIQKQFNAQKGRCYYCSCHLTNYHIDHVIPISRGGTNDPSNLVLACSYCNTSKGDKLLHEWKRGGRLL